MNFSFLPSTKAKMAPKRKLSLPQRASELNPLLQLIPNVTISSNVQEYTKHTDWEALTSSAFYRVFEYWYNSNTQHYKHIKHAFASLCKHYNGIHLKCSTILLDEKELTKIWLIHSYQEVSTETGRLWLYQELDEGDLTNIVYKDVTTFDIKDNQLLPLKELLTKCI